MLIQEMGRYLKQDTKNLRGIAGDIVQSALNRSLGRDTADPFRLEAGGERRE